MRVLAQIDHSEGGAVAAAVSALKGGVGAEAPSQRAPERVLEKRRSSRPRDCRWMERTAVLPEGVSTGKRASDGPKPPRQVSALQLTTPRHQDLAHHLSAASSLSL